MLSLRKCRCSEMTVSTQLKLDYRRISDGYTKDGILQEFVKWLPILEKESFLLLLTKGTFSCLLTFAHGACQYINHLQAPSAPSHRYVLYISKPFPLPHSSSTRLAPKLIQSPTSFITSFLAILYGSGFCLLQCSGVIPPSLALTMSNLLLCLSVPDSSTLLDPSEGSVSYFYPH